MRAAIYCRLSKEDEDCAREPGRESESIQNQKSMLAAYAAAHGYEIYQIYADEDYSGIDRARPAFNEMLRAAEAHRFEVILAKTQSRFTRDMELVEKYLHGKFLEWGIRFIAVVDHVDTDDEASKKSRQINGLVNQWYLEDLSDNVRSVLLHKRREGKYIASFALYGYRKDPLDKNHLLIDPEAAAVVRRIFSLYLAGWGPTRIAALLNQENLPNPTRYKRQQGIAYVNANADSHEKTEGLWARSTIYGMLRNQTYAGDLVQGRHQKVSYKSKKTITLPRAAWIIAPGTHEPIISTAQFAQVQQLIALRGREGKTGRVHPLAGKVRCGVCGAVMERAGSGSLGENGCRTGYLRCRTHARKHDGCIPNTIRAEVVENLVLGRIRQYIGQWFDPDALPTPAGAAAPESAVDTQEAAQALHGELQKREKALQTLYLDRTAGVIGRQQFEELNRAFLAEKAQLQARLALLETASGGSPPVPSDDEWRRGIRRLARADTLTRELAVALVDHVSVYGRDTAAGQRKIEIFWNF